ncbi:TPA: DUF3577 domain-containing protein, partial [Escherichia coli]
LWFPLLIWWTPLCLIRQILTRRFRLYAYDEDRKVLIGFTMSNPSTDIFTLNRGEHAGEQRVSLKARLIKVEWIKIGQDMVYKTEKSESIPPQNGNTPREYAENSF